MGSSQVKTYDLNKEDKLTHNITLAGQILVKRFCKSHYLYAHHIFGYCFVAPRLKFEYTEVRFFKLKQGSRLPKKLFYWLQSKPFKYDEKCFSFHLKGISCSQDIYIENINIYLSC